MGKQADRVIEGSREVPGWGPGYGGDGGGAVVGGELEDLAENGGGEGLLWGEGGGGEVRYDE